MTEPCPVCGVPMDVEDGLWYCAGCDAYHGEAPEDPARAETDCQCPVGDACPCEADGDDGLCKCCRAPDGEHRGTCASEALATASLPNRKD